MEPRVHVSCTELIDAPELQYRTHMQIHLENRPEVHTIVGYGDREVRLRDRVLRTSCIVTPTALRTDWPPRSVAALTAAHCAVVLELRPAIVLLATGPRLEFPDSSVYAAFLERGVGLEVMDLGAACRTYNVLLAEDRNVAAAILL
jgi:uncharacterized protein